MSKCCPDEPRIEGRLTRDGRPVDDLHHHVGLLRGKVLGEARETHWYANGRLTPMAETAIDLEGVATW